MKDNNYEWKKEEDMLKYFETILAENHSAQIEPPSTFYMDSPDNTDNAWKEVKVFNIHLSTTESLDDLFSNNTQSSSNNDQSSTHNNTMSNISTPKSMLWSLSSEDLLVRLPMEQVSFMNAIIRTFAESNNNQKKDI